MSAVNERVRISDISGLIKFIKELSSSDAAVADAYIEAYRELSGDADLSDREREYYRAVLEEKLSFAETVGEPGLFTDDGSRRYRLFYCAGDIMPDVLTYGMQAKEDRIYKSVSVECAAELRGCTYFDRLVRMQQNNCPVRMTELTSDPLVALYFACKNGGEVSVFAVPDTDCAGGNGDRALMLSCLPGFELSAKRWLYEAAINSLPARRFQQLKGGSRYLDESAEELYRRVTTEKPFFKRDIDPIDLLKPLFVIPEKTTERLALRGTAYLLSGLSADADEAARKLIAERVSVIRIEDAENVLSELSLLGINGLSLSAGISAVSEYIRSTL